METNVSQKHQLMKVLQETPAVAIAELDFVKDRYVNNYNACHKEKIGELMYHRQVVHFKQAIANSDQLKKCDQFSLYACFATAAVNGYSLDPADDEVYLIPRGGKAYLQRQAGAHVKRLMRTGQIIYADQSKIVYQGDDFEVMNGRVLKHVEKFQSETMISGYIRFLVDDKGNDRFFIYRKSDWENWKKKSPLANGDNWSGNNGQPIPAFLRTKIVLHACKEKCWATGNTSPTVEQYTNVEVDADEADETNTPAQVIPIKETIKETVPVDDDSFASVSSGNGTVTHDDDDF